MQRDPLQEELDNLSPLLSLSPLSPSPMRRIYRVPKRLRRVNEEAYTPQVVSIGPLHHGKEHLKAMEEHKKRYLQHFLGRTRDRVSFSNYIQMIKDKEGRLRDSYAEPIEFDSDQFVRIVLVDAAFVIEFLLGSYSPDVRVEDDYIFYTRMMRRDVFPDLRLLENQLPFFILQFLFEQLFSPDQKPSLLDISYSFFKSQIDSQGKEENFNKSCFPEVVHHFVDLIRILYLPSLPLEPKPRGTHATTAVNTAVPSVTELVRAGVKFRVRTDSSDLFDIKFSDGILEIPKLKIFDTTEVTQRNLVAFEQCQEIEEDYLTGYDFLMNLLVKTPKDVELLVENGIIENWLGNAEKISTLFDNLGNGVMETGLYYLGLREDLKKYCESRRNIWMANLKQDYFNTPWSIIKVVTAAILLILTLIQTACSIKSIP